MVGDCETCMYEPEFERCDTLTEQNAYQTGVCIKDGEPLIMISGQFYVEASDGGVNLLKNCKSHVHSKIRNQKKGQNDARKSN